MERYNLIDVELYTLKELLQFKDKLSNWEYNFYIDILKYQTISQKQKDIIDKIHIKIIKQTVPNFEKTRRDMYINIVNTFDIEHLDKIFKVKIEKINNNIKITI